MVYHSKPHTDPYADASVSIGQLKREYSDATGAKELCICCGNLDPATAIQFVDDG